ncbi:MAG: hypothetical protein J2P43_01260 [Candidatus Dormibacteraeota bacterium]|nr:hypothetical protein [Candidatus Dormibacteraeota bacterium]
MSGPSRPQVKLLHAPLHGPSWVPALGRRAFRTRAHSIGWTEGHRGAWRWLDRHRGRYQHFTATGTRTDARGRIVGHGVVVSVRNDCRVIAHGFFRIAREQNLPGTGIKYHHERWAVWVVYTTPQRVKVLDVRWHPPPGPLRRPRVLPEYRNAVRAIEANTRELRARHRPDLVVSGGDLQLGRGQRPISPNRVFARLGMDGQNRGINWLAWSNNWRAVKGWRINLRNIVKTKDHAWEAWMVRVLEPK